MIDFRYHIISIVAVFLALGIGILMGSFVLGENLVNQLNRELEDIQSTNDELRERTVEMSEEIESLEAFALGLRAHLVAGALVDRNVVLVTYQDTEGNTLDAVGATIEQAGASIASTITFARKVEMATEAELDQLALIVGSTGGDPEEVRVEAGELLGRRLAGAARPEVEESVLEEEDAADDPPVERAANTQLDRLLEELSDADFLDVERPDGGQTVPPGSVILVVCGDDADPPFPLAGFSLGYLTALGDRDLPVVVAEGGGSAWELTTMVRGNGEAQDTISTVDSVDSAFGPSVLALTLQNVLAGSTGGHYGRGTGAEGLIPGPVPTPTEEPTPTP